MKQVQKLVRAIAKSRNRYLNLISALSEEQAQHKLESNVWNAIEITEHLFWAEQGALFGMWKTLYAHRNGQLSVLKAIHEGLSIEEEVARTLQLKEIMPAVAPPRMGGTLIFGSVSLQGFQFTLKSLGSELSDDDLLILAHPHPISGVLDFRQRLEFIRFHIDRHYDQVKKLIAVNNVN